MSDEDLFRDAMSDVAPLQHKRVSHGRAPVEVTPAQLERREAALGNRDRTPKTDPNYLTLGEVKQLDPRAILAWKKDGVQHEVFRKLKSGKYPIEGKLDLHRLTVKESRAEVFRFTALALAKGWRTVLISHGRGERSPTPARIKSYVAHWLTQIPDIIAYHSAIQPHGGTGSVYVMLRKSEAARERARELHGLKSEGGSET